MSCDPSRVGDTPTLVATLIRKSDGLALDVSTATTKTIYLTNPAIPAVTLALTAAFVTNGTDGKISVTLTAGTLNAPGIWRYEGFVILASGQQFTGAESTFEVTTSRFGDSQ